MKKKIDKLNELILKKIVCPLVGETTTDSNQLNKACEILFKKKYLGTFPLDMIPYTIKKGQSFIFNLDTSNKPGSHWVGCYCYKNNEVLVYDSFARKTSKIADSLNNFLSSIDTEYDREQEYDETNCGARSISFLIICHHWSWKLARQL